MANTSTESDGLGNGAARQANRAARRIGHGGDCKPGGKRDCKRAPGRKRPGYSIAGTGSTPACPATILHLLAAALGLLLLPPALAQGARYPFALETERDEGGHRIVAINRGPAPVSVRVDISRQVETVSDRTFPLDAVVPASSREVLAHIRAAFPGQGYSFKTQASWMPGDFRAVPDPGASYRLPWPDGLAFRVSQAHGGPVTTHTTPGSRYAVDIPMPEGTPVVAARAGMVLDAEGDESEGGTTPDMLTKANAVRILHEDGTLATYAHLSFGGVFVHAGQRVAEGERIGLSGSTGYSSGPHLHFAILRVERKDASLELASLPFRFRVGNPPLAFAPKAGMFLEADYAHPGEMPTTRGPGLARRIARGLEDRDELPAAWLALPGLLLLWWLWPSLRNRRR